MSFPTRWFCLARFGQQYLNLPKCRLFSSRSASSANNGVGEKRKAFSNRQKLGFAIGGTLTIPAVWYVFADSQKRRLARVTVEGAGRFVRYQFIYILYSTHSLSYLYSDH